MNQNSLLSVDWSLLPVPLDDGGSNHLMGNHLPPVELSATDGTRIDMSGLRGRTVIYIYPMTGQPGTELPTGWDAIPGARGCTPQSCAFRDQLDELRASGADRVFGLSTQTTAYQHEAVTRLHLPFPLLSDCEFQFATAMGLPVFIVGKTRYLKRMTLIADNARISKVFYPVFPPDRNPADVLAWLKAHKR